MKKYGLRAKPRLKCPCLDSNKQLHLRSFNYRYGSKKRNIQKFQHSNAGSERPRVRITGKLATTIWQIGIRIPTLPDPDCSPSQTSCGSRCRRCPPSHQFPRQYPRWEGHLQQFVNSPRGGEKLKKKEKKDKNTYELKTFTKRGLHYSHYAMLRIRIGLDPNCFAGSVLRSDQDINSNFFTIDFVLVSFSF